MFLTVYLYLLVASTKSSFARLILSLSFLLAALLFL